MYLVDGLVAAHRRVFDTVQWALEDWFLGLLARLVFAGVLFLYFFNSAVTKLGEGPLGFIHLADGAYFQILPPVVEQYGYDASQVPFLPWGLIVHAGTYAEFVLPVLIVLGLFTRLAALGMVVFVAVQSYVDVAFHGVDDTTVGALFDRVQDSTISDQRVLWLFPLVYLVVRGAGAISLDSLLRPGVPGRSPTGRTGTPRAADRFRDPAVPL